MPAHMSAARAALGVLVAAAASAALGACAVAQSVTPEYFPPAGGGDDLPFSAVVQVGDTLYLAGQIGSAPGGFGPVEGGIQAETRQTLENIKAVVESHGSSMDRVVKCTVFLADIDEWAAMNEVYVTYFPNKPARSALGVSGLAADARVEIECIAIAAE